MATMQRHVLILQNGGKRAARLCTPIHAALFCAVIVSSAIRSANFYCYLYSMYIFLPLFKNKNSHIQAICKYK